MRQARPTDTQSSLLAAATTLFCERGFRGTSTRDICSRAGASSTAITYHFGSKERLYRHILQSFASLQLEHAQSVLSKDPQSRPEFAARFQIFFEQLLDVYLDNRETLRIFFREFEQLLPHGEEDVIGEMLKTSHAIAAFVRRAIDLEFVRPNVDADIVAGLLMDRVLNQARFVHAHAQYFGVSTLDPKYREHWVRSTLQIVFDGINAPESPPQPTPQPNKEDQS